MVLGIAHQVVLPVVPGRYGDPRQESRRQGWMEHSGHLETVAERPSDERDDKPLPRAKVNNYRAIPVDILRDFARTQTEVTSIWQVADDVGVGRSTLHKFILGPHGTVARVRRLLGL